MHSHFHLRYILFSRVVLIVSRVRTEFIPPLGLVSHLVSIKRSEGFVEPIFQWSLFKGWREGGLLSESFGGAVYCFRPKYAIFSNRVHTIDLLLQFSWSQLSRNDFRLCKNLRRASVFPMLIGQISFF